MSLAHNAAGSALVVAIFLNIIGDRDGIND